MGCAQWVTPSGTPTQPQEPQGFNRDRFVLSAGHGCMLIYALLHLTGYDSVTIDDIKQFRQWGSKTPGHRETLASRPPAPGAGISNAVVWPSPNPSRQVQQGRRQARSPPTYHGDGCNQEGIASEACSWLATQLGKLIALYDNHITIDDAPMCPSPRTRRL